MNFKHLMVATILAAGVASPAIAESEKPQDMEKAMSAAPCMHQKGMMMGGRQGGGMAMMPMMQERQAMMDAHMKKMETHMENIESLLRQLVDLQKQ